MLVDVLKFFLTTNIIGLHERYAIFHQQTPDMHVRSQKKNSGIYTPTQSRGDQLLHLFAPKNPFCSRQIPPLLLPIHIPRCSSTSSIELGRQGTGKLLVTARATVAPRSHSCASAATRPWHYP